MKRRIVLAALGAGGLALFLWPALRAPTVVFSDSQLDMAWARSGEGIWKSPPPTMHPAKAGYLLFLRAAMGAVPRVDAARSVVIVQSLLLWASIAATAIFVGRRRGFGVGAALYVLLVLFLRLRDGSSAVMSETVSAALLLPWTALAVFPWWKRPAGFLVHGAGAAAIFWIRPNVGLVALLVAAVAARPPRAIAWIAAGFAAAILPAALATRGGTEAGALHGLAHPIYAGAAEYYWLPSLRPWPEGPPEKREREELAQVAARWKALIGRRDADARRELLWRSLAGFFGTEYYDARWSAAYRRLTTASRLAAPFLILLALCVLFTRPFRGIEAPWNLAAPLFVLLLLVQNLVLGSHPRYLLPFLPSLFLLALVALADATRWSRGAAVVLAASLALVLRDNRGALAWEWGRIESAGVVLDQRIPKGALPASGPATLHLRAATTVLPTDARLEVLADDGTVLPSRRRAPGSPVLTVEIPARMLAENARRDVAFSLRSAGGYDAYHFMLFPLVPPPWASDGTRLGSAQISPSTGITRGALDWWAHAGADPD